MKSPDKKVEREKVFPTVQSSVERVVDIGLSAIFEWKMGNDQKILKGVKLKHF